MQKRLVGREQEFGIEIKWQGGSKKRKPRKEKILHQESSPRPHRPTGPYPVPGYGYPPHGYRGGMSFRRVDGETPKEDRMVEKIIQSIPGVVPALVIDDYNVWLSNGSRAYVDMGKVEVASAECSVDTFDLLIQEKANELLLNKILKRLKRERPDIKSICLYKNNVDIGAHLEEEATYGSHHNYSYVAKKRDRIFSVLKNFLPVALPLSGSGHIAPMNNGKRVYCFSQRAFHITDLQSENTTMERSLINTRRGFGVGGGVGPRGEELKEKTNLTRLHFIAYDATRCEFQTWLVSSVMHLVLRLAEEGWQVPPKLALIHPIKELHALNSRIDLDHQVETISGRIDIIEYNRIFLAAAKKLKPLSAMEKKCLKEWARVLDLLKAGAWKKLVGELDWATKLWLLKKKMRKYGFGLDDTRAWKIAMGYHNISSSPRQSWFAWLDECGYIRHLVSQKDIDRALKVPPNTRAKSRSEMIKWLLLKRSMRQRLIGLSWFFAEFEDDADYNNYRCQIIYFSDPNDPFSPAFDSAEKLEKLLKDYRHASKPLSGSGRGAPRSPRNGPGRDSDGYLYGNDGHRPPFGR